MEVAFLTSERHRVNVTILATYVLDDPKGSVTIPWGRVRPSRPLDKIESKKTPWINAWVYVMLILQGYHVQLLKTTLNTSMWIQSRCFIKSSASVVAIPGLTFAVFHVSC